jgi:methylmalonyl-CoA/ethylmalonyl-CoA epimerase
MIRKFDHVGIVIKNTEEVASLFSNLFGFKITEPRTFLEEGFRSTLISKEEVTLELIEPIGSEGIIQKFVEKHGGGLHHISIQVDDLEGEIKRLKTQGVKFVNEEPSRVSETSKIVFIHPRSTTGLLIELIQRTGP